MNLDAHILVHDDVRNKYKCPSCDNFFTRQDYLAVHFRDQHQDDDENALNFIEPIPRTRQVHAHKCPHCTESFKRAEHLKVHLASDKHRIGDSLKVHCDRCKKTYANKSSFNRHIRNKKCVVEVEQDVQKDAEQESDQEAEQECGQECDEEAEDDDDVEVVVCVNCGMDCTMDDYPFHNCVPSRGNINQ